MTVALLLNEGMPIFERLFPPVPLFEQVQQTPMLIIGVLDLSLALAQLALWRAAPDFRAFRTLGIFYLLVSVQQFLLYFGGTVPSECVRAFASLVLVEAAGEAMQVRRRSWTRIFWPIYLFVSIAVFFPQLAFTAEWPLLLSQVPLAILIVQGFQRGIARDRIIAVAFGIYFFVRLTLSGTAHKLIGLNPFVAIGGWHWFYTTVGLTLLGGLTLTIFVRDLIRDRSEKQRFAAELAASRAVQQVLIPEKTPAIPGFQIRSVYTPYGEVGGDFFQILPASDGGVLIAIGDVSGKGMPAAMMVSLLVGTLHALVEMTTSPGKLLNGLNRLVQGRSHDGFTTCLILRAGADGAVTFANAGHISPYCRGAEWQGENSLPLGLVPDITYPESSFQLKPGEQLTLMSDGVAEAQTAAGLLFGFDRMADMLRDNTTASELAAAAQAFGQEDDITVLTIALLPIEVAHA